VLEVGCGPGGYWAEVAEMIPPSWHITLSDFSPGMVAEARQRLAALDRSFTVIHADVQDLPFPDESLGALDYTYLQHYEAWLPDELVFRKASSGPWTHHLHVMEPSSPRWKEFILIRDYLRQHPPIADAYAGLKQALALVFEDDISASFGPDTPAAYSSAILGHQARGILGQALIPPL